MISIKLQSNFIEITPRHGCSPVNLLHIFRTPFPNNISGGLLLYVQFYAPKCTGLLLCSKQKHRKYLFFFKIFQKRVRWLRVNENKITNKNAFNWDYLGITLNEIKTNKFLFKDFFKIREAYFNL